MRYLSPTFMPFLMFVFVMACSLDLYADSFQSLLMPGPVINAHEKYEHDCEQCHDTSNKEKQGQRCLQCHAHENILDDLNSKTGLHGRLPATIKNNCKHCHTDHEGRSAKIVLLDTATFDHQKTDFLLEGVHKKTACNACHKSEEKYSQAAGDCYSCHKKSDVHEGKQGKKCASCHQASSWKKTSFNHDKTDFPLKGAHKDSLCAACHINQKYKDTARTCFGCHQINDIHSGNFGKKCDSCHTTKEWRSVRFEHDKKTDFALHGKHKSITCDSCHKATTTDADRFKSELDKQCFACHKNDDSHKTRYGKKCDTCHNAWSWQKSTFDHDKKTDFALLGKHKTTTCNSCHKGNLYKNKVSGNCIDCHRKDDIHKGRQGNECNSCHNTKGWHNDVIFDHDLSRFPLIGMHATTQCEECHLSTVYADTQSSCNACHSADDVHQTKLGTNCQLCHNPNSWATWTFNHNKNTAFKLDGAHQTLGCFDCHQTKTHDKVTASKDCISCHRSDDIHHRSFGRHCNECHSTTSFKDINIKR